ncbi:MAG TPA: TlpA family protein disulfide reductase [Flavobacteriales bacterium]|nr:TlpA family protein disulfide reductase [Flavobacteriales bacterium]
MKNLIYICTIIVLLGCTQTNVEDKLISGVTITGKIENPKSDYAIFRSGKGKESQADTAFLDSMGKFSLFIELKEEKYGWFIHGGPFEINGITMLRSERTAMYFVPGDSIELTINPEMFDESISYYGSGGAINNYLAKRYLIEEKMGIPAKEMYALDPQAFSSKTDSIKAALITHLNLYVKENPEAPKKFTKNERANTIYSWALKRINYPEFHRNYTEFASFDLGPEYYKYLSDLNLDDSSLTENLIYKNFLNEYIASEAKKVIAEDTSLTNENIGLLEVKIQMATELFKTKDLSNYLLFNCMYQYIKQKGTKGIGALMEEFEKTCTNDEYKTKVRESYDIWKNLVEGNEAPDFACPDINEDSVSLSDFRGKYVYVDIWATWCGPCRRELPHLEKLQEEYKDKNIVFLSVSIDEDEEAWKKMVKEKKMKGIQLIAAQGWDAGICKFYGIKSIPRFLLIGKDGEIIFAKAERPSRGIDEILKNLEGLRS